MNGGMNLRIIHSTGMKHHYVLLGVAKVDPALALFGTISVREAKLHNVSGNIFSFIKPVILTSCQITANIT